VLAHIRIQPRNALLLAACWAALSPLLGATQQIKEPRERAQRIEQHLTRCAAFGFSGSALVLVGDEVLVRKGYGVADAKSGAACEPETLFDLGSLSKQFTAAAVLALQQRKTLKLDDAIERYFPNAPKDKRGVTLRQLLTHTSGLPRGASTVGSSLTSRDAFLAAVFALPLESKPGAKHSYSNLGYGLAAAAIEVATGKPFEDVMRKQVFEPAGLTNTGFRQDGRVDATRVARGRPKPIEPFPAGSLFENDTTQFDGFGDERLLAAEGWWSWGLRGAGGVLSTVDELAAWERALRSTRVLDKRSLDLFFTPERDGYACGWRIGRSPSGTTSIRHGGSTGNGFEVEFVRYPDERACVIVLGNTAGGLTTRVTNDVTTLLFGGQVVAPPETVVLDDEPRNAWSGDYRGPKGELLRIAADARGIFVEARNASAFEWTSGVAASQESKRAIEASRPIAAELADGKFAALHAAEDRNSPLFYAEHWWGRILAHHGAAQPFMVLGAAPNSDGAVVWIACPFARGEERLALQWRQGKLVKLTAHPPYASLRRLEFTGADSACDFDLESAAVRATAQLERTSGEIVWRVERRELRLVRSAAK